MHDFFFIEIKIQICLKWFFFFQTSGLPEEWDGKHLYVILDLGQCQNTSRSHSHSHSVSHSHKQMVLPPMAKTRINLITPKTQLTCSSRHEVKSYTRRTICTNANTWAADARRRVSAAVNIILSTKWTFQSPFISLSSSSSLSLTFLLFHTQADTSPSSSSSLTHYHSWTHTDTYPEMERWQGKEENTGSTLVIGLCRSSPFTSHQSNTLPSAPHSSSPLTV